MSFNPAEARKNMVDCQLRTIDVTNAAVLEAFGVVAREAFLPEHLAAFAYLDRDLPLGESGRCLMAPGPFARLVQLLAPARTERVLVVGAGCGYGVAVLARLAKEVVGLESDPELASQARRALSASGVTNASIVEGELARGGASGSLYDAILFEGALEQIPPVFAGQVSPKGRLVGVIGHGRTGRASLFYVVNGQMTARPVFDAALPPLPGFSKPAHFEFAL